MNRNERRRTHYNMLKNAGYSSKKATELKDFNRPTIEALVDLKQSHDVDLNNRLEDILSRKRKPKVTTS